MTKQLLITVITFKNGLCSSVLVDSNMRMRTTNYYSTFPKRSLQLLIPADLCLQIYCSISLSLVDTIDYCLREDGLNESKECDKYN